MSTSNYLVTSIRLSVLIFAFLLFSCVGPTPTSEQEANSLSASKVEETATPTVTTPSDSASPGHFSYTVKVLDKDTQVPIQKAEVSVRLQGEIIDTRETDSRGQVVFTFETSQANQGGELIVQAKGYEDQTFNIALKFDNPTEEVELASLSASSPPQTVITPTLTLTSTSSPSAPAPPTPMLTETTTALIYTPTPLSPTPIATPDTTTGNLAIPVVFNFGTKVYLTGFNGEGINGPNYISIGGLEGSEDARQPMFSSDRQSVMVKATIDGVIGLHKLTASGFNPQIIIRRGSAEWPVLSPDGQTVLFSEATLDYRLHRRIPSDEVETPDYLIEEVQLNGFPIFAKNLLWSADNQLVFQGCAVWIQEPGTCGTWVTPANNLNPRRIIEGNDAQPMAIQGDMVAYMQRETGKDWDIYLISIAGGEAVNLTNNDFEDGLPAISPDGNAVAYISNESGTWGLWTVNLDGQNKKHWFDINPGSGVFDTDKWSQDRMSWRR